MKVWIPTKAQIEQMLQDLHDKVRNADKIKTSRKRLLTTFRNWNATFTTGRWMRTSNRQWEGCPGNCQGGEVMGDIWDEFIYDLGEDRWSYMQDPAGLCEKFYEWLDAKGMIKEPPHDQKRECATCRREPTSEAVFIEFCVPCLSPWTDADNWQPKENEDGTSCRRHP